MRRPCPLVMVEWDDSAQPHAAWKFLEGYPEPSIVKCISVGWLIHDSADVKVVAPNVGEVDTADIQISGDIRIPTRCVTKITRLKLPKSARSLIFRSI